MARILIVEDEAHILRVMSMWLGRHGHDILEASEGEAELVRSFALDIVATDGNISIRMDEDRVLMTPSGVSKGHMKPEDLIITDMNMPVLDGLELIEALRLQDALDMPVLLLSARCDQKALAERVRPYNVHLYPKPFVPSRLVADIEQLLTPTNSSAPTAAAVQQSPSVSPGGSCGTDQRRVDG